MTTDGSLAKKQSPEEDVLQQSAELEHAELPLADIRGEVIGILSKSTPRSVSEDIVWRENMIAKLSAELPEELGIKLRTNQITAIKKLIEFLKTTDETTGYFLQPTGAGKTFLFGLISKLLDVKTTILVPSTTLAKQTIKELTKSLQFDEGDVGIIQSGKRVPVNAKILVSTYQSHISRLKFDGPTFDQDYLSFLKRSPLVICDEAHRALGTKTAQTYEIIEEGEVTDEEINAQEQALKNLDLAISKSSLRLGFTATPKLSQKNVASHFGKCIAKETYGNLIESGVLVPFDINQVKGVCERDEITDSTTAEDEGVFMKKQEMYLKLLEKWEERQKELQEATGREQPLRTMVFCPTIKGCDEFVEIAESKGWKCKIVTSREKTADKDVLKKSEESLLKGETDFIVTVDMLKEGYDCRPINGVILARATTSPAVKIQAAGRGARTQNKDENKTFGEKKTCHVFEGVFKIRERGEVKGVGKGQKEKNRPKETGYLRSEGEPYALADCLAISGEDVQDVVINSTEIEQKKLLEFNTQGVAVITLDEKPTKIVYLDVYIQNMSHTDKEKIMEYGKPQKFLLNGNLVRFGEIQVGEAYIKEEIDAILKGIYSKEVHFDEEGVGIMVNPYKTISEQKIAGYKVINLRVYLAKKLNEKYLDTDEYKEFMNFMTRHQIRAIYKPDRKYFGANGNKIAPHLFDKNEIDEFLEKFRSGEILIKDNASSKNKKIKIIEMGGVDSKIAFSVTMRNRTFEMPLMTSLLNFEKILKELKQAVIESDWDIEDLSALSERLDDYIQEIYDYHEKGGGGQSHFSEQIIERKIEPLIEDIQQASYDKTAEFEEFAKTGT